MKFSSAFEVMKMIKVDYGENETQDAMYLYKLLLRLKFRRGYNQQRYINEFDTIMADFAERGIPFDAALQRIVFMSKIEGIENLGSPTSTFFTQMSIQTKEIIESH